MKKIDAKDVAIRAGKTFVECAVGAAIPLLSTLDLTNMEAMKAALLSIGIAAISAGVSAAWNVVIGALKKEAE